MIKIVPISEDTLLETQRLVKSVFPFQSLGERLSFIAFSKKSNMIIRAITRLFGVREFINFWIAVNDENKVAGTTGLYRCLKDENEAVWLAWFCVAPKDRGKGVGKQLLWFSIEKAKKMNARYLRLYTSDDPNEKQAQLLYEKFGLKEIRRVKKLFYTKIIRELKLK